MPFSKATAALLPLLATFSSALPQTGYGSGSGSVVNSTTCNGKSYVYEELAGYGFIPNDARDKFGDTIGGIGSSIAFDRHSWKKRGKNEYTGLLYALPDRGWNTEGTLNYQNRIQKIQVTFSPNESATVADPAPPNVQFKYLDTILLSDPAGKPVSGLDGGLTGPYKRFPGYDFDFPSANYTGDGFGGAGAGGSAVVIDTEGIALGKDGTFWISDEYGDYTYHFDKRGNMIGAIRPPPAFIPQRNGAESFSADSPPRYNQALHPTPADPVTGRSNNQGLEGLSINPQGTKLYALGQSALRQDSGKGNPGTRYTRFIVYNIAGPNRRSPKVEAEYVVALNNVSPGDTTARVARDSEVHYISDTQFLVLARDSGAGRGQGASTTSVYRRIDVIDISKATNVAGKSDCTTCAVAPAGVLNANTTAAQYCTGFIDFNVNSQLNRFGVRNGGAQSDGLLNEKWESIAVVPAFNKQKPNEYYVLSLSDNDFITQNGYLKGGQFKYADGSGYSLENQALLFKVTLPQGSSPLIS